MRCEMGSFVIILIFNVLIIWLRSVESSEYRYDENYDDDELIRKIRSGNEKLCSSLCVCTMNDNISGLANMELLCSQDGFMDRVQIKIEIFIVVWIYFTCENENSYKIVPNLNTINESPRIILTDCVMPSNESIYQLTSKFSKNIIYLEIKVTKGNLNLNKKYFEGFSILEGLDISVSDSTIVEVNITDDVFENLVSLTNLKLTNITLPSSVAWNKLEKFEETSLDSEQVILSNRSLLELPKILFVNKKILKRLDLGFNELKELIDGDFDLMENLK